MILLPYPNFALSARVMQSKDLVDLIHRIDMGLDRLHQVIEDNLYTQPDFQAWRGFEAQLAEYGIECAHELEALRGSKTCYHVGCPISFTGWDAHAERFLYHQQAAESGGLLKPNWFGNPALHITHQAALVTKDPEVYGPIFGSVTGELPIMWTD